MFSCRLITASPFDYMVDIARAPATRDVDWARRCFNRNMQTFGMFGDVALLWMAHRVQAFSKRHLLHSPQLQAMPEIATYLHPAVRVPGYAGPAKCFCGRPRPALRPAVLGAIADTSHAPALRPMRN